MLSPVLSPGPALARPVSALALATAAIHHHRHAELGNWGEYLGYARRGRRPNRHRNEHYRVQRGEKFVQIELPDFDKQRRIWVPDLAAEVAAEVLVQRCRVVQGGEATQAERVRELRQQGLSLPRQWAERERPVHVADSGTVFEEYIPPEGDSRHSLLSRERVTELAARLRRGPKTGWTASHVNEIKTHEPDWSEETFPTQAEDIYKKAHTAMAAADQDALHLYVTDFCFPEVWNEVKLRSIKWEYVENIEAPKVVLIRSQQFLDKSNVYSQVTVKFHARQKLAVYDQWGRLILGSPEVAQETVEYVVLEKHMADPYGSWRLHAKIRPKWLQRSLRQPLRLTFPKPDLPKQQAIHA